MQKSDLDQIGKVVRKIVREEVKTEVKDSTRTIEGQIRFSRMEIQNEINELDDRMKNVEIRVDSVDGKMGRLDKKVDKVRKDILKKLEVVSHALDKQTMEVGKRVTRIENHLGLSDNN